MRIVLTCILTFIAASLFGQGFRYPVINVKGQQVKDFIRDGWMILDSAAGDLNNDHLNDVVIILQRKDSIAVVKDIEDTVITQPRILIILFKNRTDNSFLLLAQSNSFILNHDSPTMDDPFDELTINAGILKIKFRLFHSMGSWYIDIASYKFRYQKEEFVLIGVDLFSIHRATLDFEEYSYNFLSKKRTLTKGNENNRKKNTTWKVANIFPLKTLKTFIKPFTWKVETDVYL